MPTLAANTLRLAMILVGMGVTISRLGLADAHRGAGKSMTVLESLDRSCHAKYIKVLAIDGMQETTPKVSSLFISLTSC